MLTTNARLDTTGQLKHTKKQRDTQNEINVLLKYIMHTQTDQTHANSYMYIYESSERKKGN